MKRLRVVLVMTLIVVLSSGAGQLHAAALPAAAPAVDKGASVPSRPPDAQSTSGPTPLPGVRPAGGQAASSAAVVIADVPAYTWHQGCGPTAAGMVLGYWDGHGFPNLVPGSAATQTTAVNDMIGTQGPSSNWTDYCLPLDYAPAPIQPDLSEPPVGDEHADNCVADFMNTSQSFHDNYYGWSWFSHVGPAVVNYVSSLLQPYIATSSNYYMGSTLTWTLLQNEIDAGRPMVFLVDTDADGWTDHFVTVVGYDSPAGVRKYGCFDTYGTSVRWENFQQMGSGVSWGVYGAVAFEMASSNHTPAVGTVEPSHGSGSAGQLTWFITSWTDPDGYGDLKQCYFHIGDSPSIVGNVTLLYNAQRDRLWIRSDDGLEWLGGCSPEGPGVAENSQAILHCEHSRRAASGDTLEMKWGLEFKKEFVGAKKLGLKARDTYGARARGEWVGTWTIE